MSKKNAIPDTLSELRVPIDSVSPYEPNPRRGAVETIKESLVTHGQYRPLVVNRRTGVVLAGNHTRQAALELGWDTIAVTFVDVDEDTAARIVLVDNRANDQAGYDDDALAALLQSLPGGLAGTGWDDDDLASLLASLDGGDTFTLPDGAPAFRTMTFALTGEQADVVEGALARALETDPAPDGENRNAHALTLLAEAYTA